MAVRIVDIKLIPNSTWNDINGVYDWNSVKNTNAAWQTISQTAIVGQNVKIEVEVTEGTWDSVKELHVSWSVLVAKFTDWFGLKNR